MSNGGGKSNLRDVVNLSPTEEVDEETDPLTEEERLDEKRRSSEEIERRRGSSRNDSWAPEKKEGREEEGEESERVPLTQSESLSDSSIDEDEIMDVSVHHREMKGLV